MKKLAVEKIDREKVLRYLGIKSDDSDESLNKEIDKAIDIVIKSAEPRCIYKCFDIEELEESSLLEGEDIFAHLEGCSKAILFAFTLSAQVEQEIRASQAVNVRMPVILDACASVLVEQMCDKYCDSIEKSYKKEGFYLTGRFSPGYGDFPIEKQQMLLDLTDAGRRIGLFATENSILTPRKSVTAVIGVSEKEVSGKMAGCKNCALKEKCIYRKEGTPCDI